MGKQIGIFDDVREAAHGQEGLSIRWYKQKIQDLLPKPMVRPMIREGMREGKVTVRPNFGMMNLFYYRPKEAERLKYYDIFPLVIPMGRRLNNGFVGINFHYLSIPMRWMLLEKLQMFQTPSELDAFDTEEGMGEVIKLMWPQIKKKRGVAPIVRRYLTENMKSKFLKIELSEMLIAVSLPVEKFYTGPWGKRKKVQPQKVFKDTRRSIMTGVQ